MTCSFKKCGDTATIYPVILLYAPRDRYPDAVPARACCNIPVCPTHQRVVDAFYLMTDAGWQEITSVFMSVGKVVPSRKDIEVEFIDVKSPEAMSFQRSLVASQAEQN